MTAGTSQTQGERGTDRIEKKMELRAPRSRVWKAIASSEEFGAWFGMNLDGEFVAGETRRGRFTHPSYSHLIVEMMIDRIEPERYFSYRWHPNAVDTQVDYSGDPTTLVEFILEEIEGGTAVTIVESGFDRIPVGRRHEAFRVNDGGWTAQIRNLERYVS